MAKKDGFKGDKDGTPVNGPKRSGGGAGETTRLAGSQFRSSITDNPGSMPYGGGANAGKGTTSQDSHGDADLYEEPSDNGVGDEHQESAADKDVGDYYKELSTRRPPNYSKNSNLQAKQAPLDLSPADGGDGFIGSNTGPAVDFSYITGKKGYSEDLPIWQEKSSFTGYADNSGSTDSDEEVPHEEDSRDETAPWKHVETGNGLPQTHRTKDPIGEGAPLANVDARDEGGGNPDTQSIPSVDSGDKDTSDMPQTEFTNNDGGGAPKFKFSGQTQPENLYRPKPRD